MQEITLKEFKGINLDEGQWQQGFASYVVGMDLYGLAKNPNKISYPGVLQGIFQVSAGTQAASPSAVTELVTGFITFNGSDFAIGAANPARVYRRDGGTWKWVSGTGVGTNGVSCDNGVSPTANLIVYGTNLYYAQKNYLGKYDNTNSSSQFQSFTNSTVTPRPMKILNGNLYIGNDNVVAMYDGSIFTASKLSIDSSFTIRSIEVFANYLYITADNGTFSKLYVWDGISPKFNTFIELREESIAPTLQVSEGKLWLIANRGISTPGSPIYQYNGSEIVKIQILPILRNQTNGTTEYGGSLLIASNETVTSTYEDGLAGCWLIGRHSANYPYYATLLFAPRSLTNTTLGAITPSYIAAQDIGNGTYEIFEIQGSKANATNIWQSLHIDAGSTREKMWHGIKFNAETLPVGTTVVIKYRLDDTSAFTTLKTFSTSTNLKNYISIGRSSRTIDLRIELTASSSETTRLHSITLLYDVTNK